jgi:hypothetical protein
MPKRPKGRRAGPDRMAFGGWGMATESDERRWREKTDDVGRSGRGWIEGWTLAFAAVGVATVLALLAFALVFGHDDTEGSSAPAHRAAQGCAGSAMN